MTVFWVLPVLAVHLALGVWMVRVTPDPRIDVDVVHTEACKALLNGTSPYNLTFKSIYTDEENARYYPPGSIRDGQVQGGFPYPPVILLMDLPSYVLVGDYRYSQAIALTLAGALLGYLCFNWRGILAASLLLFTPRILHILESGWTESYSALFLAWAVFTAIRTPRLLFLPLGLFFASKQHLVLALPLLVLLAGGWGHWRAAWNLGWKTIAVALVVTVPLALWNLTAFRHSCLGVQLVFRNDALSYIAAVGPALGSKLPTWIGAATALLAAGVALWRSPPTASGFAAGVGVVFIALFAMSPHAFCNHYFVSIAALCAAVAAAGASPSGPTTAHDCCLGKQK